MANLAATVAALEKYCGFSAARVRTVARRLLEEEVLTPGAPGVAVEINEADFAILLLGVASGVPIPRVAQATLDLAGTVPDGTAAMPAHLKPEGDAFNVLHDIVWNAAHGDGSLKYDVEIVGQWAEVAFHRDGVVARFMAANAMPGHWQSTKARTSTRIPASALALAAHNLFSGDNQ